MNARPQAESVLKQLDFDFSDFTLEKFIGRIEAVRHHRVFTVLWDLPPVVFGAWMTDGKNATEFIFYRQDLTAFHQVHIQLHELGHFLFGHDTLDLSAEYFANLYTSGGALPINSQVCMTPSDRSVQEAEAEAFASLVQQQVIRHHQVERLSQGYSSNEKIAGYLKNLGLI